MGELQFAPTACCSLLTALCSLLSDHCSLKSLISIVFLSAYLVGFVFFAIDLLIIRSIKSIRNYIVVKYYLCFSIGDIAIDLDKVLYIAYVFLAIIDYLDRTYLPCSDKAYGVLIHRHTATRSLYIGDLEKMLPCILDIDIDLKFLSLHHWVIMAHRIHNLYGGRGV